MNFIFKKYSEVSWNFIKNKLITNEFHQKIFVKIPMYEGAVSLQFQNMPLFS